MKTFLHELAQNYGLSATLVIALLGLMYLLKRGKLEIHFRYPRSKRAVKASSLRDAAQLDVRFRYRRTSDQ